MPERFDPYHRWLGISPKDQPPNHYRLLGIDPFESDPDVIATAADQRMAHVRSLQLGEHAETSQKILNELAAARLCLLNTEEKREYDATLRTKLHVDSPPLPSEQPQIDLFPGEAPPIAVDIDVSAAARNSSALRGVGKVAKRVLLLAVAGGLTLALMTLLKYSSPKLGEDGTRATESPSNSRPVHEPDKPGPVGTTSATAESGPEDSRESMRVEPASPRVGKPGAVDAPGEGSEEPSVKPVPDDSSGNSSGDSPGNSSGKDVSGDNPGEAVGSTPGVSDVDGTSRHETPYPSAPAGGSTNEPTLETRSPVLTAHAGIDHGATLSDNAPAANK